MATHNLAAPPSSEHRRTAPSSVADSARDESIDATTGGPLYERDFYSWTQQQAALLRDGRLADIDVVHLTEEIETLGRSERAALRSAYRLIALHILKLLHQPERRSRSWNVTLVRERENVQHILQDNPGLKPQRQELFEGAYATARKEASAETGLSLRAFPTSPTFTVDDAEGKRFIGSDSDGERLEK